MKIYPATLSDAARISEQLFMLEAALRGIDCTLEDINRNLAELVAPRKQRKARKMTKGTE